MEKLIITAAINGSALGKGDVSSLPVDPEEIVEDTWECFKAGASIIHYHARDRKGRPTADWRIYHEIDKMIRDRCDVLLQHTFDLDPQMTWREKLEAGIKTGGDLQIQPLQCPWDPAEPMTQSLLEEYAKALKARGMRWQMVVYDMGGIERVRDLIGKGLVEEPYNILVILGERYGIPADPRNLLRMIDSLPQGSIYHVLGISKHQLPMAALSILFGGHVRVGLEDGIYYAEDALAESNVQIVSKVARISRELGREVATPDEARRMHRIGH